MKKVASIVLAALLVLPVLSLSGCACDGDKSSRGHHGGK